MPWTDEQWESFTSVLRRGFVARDEFTTADANVYRLLLDTVDPAAAMTAVRELVLEGQEFRPRPGAIVERCRRDAGKPTFEEACLLIFGADGILAARPAGPLRYGSERERHALVNAAATERATEVHPLVGSFALRQGLDRLRSLAIDDPDYGELRRKELREAWDRHAAATDGREVAALAAGADRAQLGMRSFDPLAALAIDKPRQLEEQSG